MKISERSVLLRSFCSSEQAQMAELVDALVSNTNAARRAGSILALGTDKRVCQNRHILFFLFCIEAFR